jgi:S1-C subfamily serine protease
MAVGSLVAKEDASETGVRLPRATLFVRGDDVAEAARQIAAHGFVERPMIGALMDDDTNRIEVLLPGGPAEIAGLADGDAIVQVGSLPVASHADLTRALLRRRAGDPVRITVERNGERILKTIVLAPFSAPEAPARAPLPGAVLELSCGGEPQEGATDAKKPSELVFTFVEVAGDSAVGRAGVVAGDRLLEVDGRPARHFLQRHRVRPDAAAPSKLKIEHEGQVREITLPSQ